MDISPALATALAALTNVHDLDLETQLQGLIACVQSAVASSLGLTMTTALQDTAVSFTVGHDTPPYIAPPVGTAPDSTACRMASEVRTSLLIPLTAVTATPTDAATLLLYAAAPGACVDLAADLSYALNLDPSNLILDKHLTAPAAVDGITGLDGYDRINQAIGMLIEQGHTADTAHEQLHRHAALDHSDLHTVAEATLRTSSDPTGAT